MVPVCRSPLGGVSICALRQTDRDRSSVHIFVCFPHTGPSSESVTADFSGIFLPFIGVVLGREKPHNRTPHDSTTTALKGVLLRTILLTSPRKRVCPLHERKTYLCVRLRVSCCPPARTTVNAGLS